MGREVRRVPPDWKHPRRGRNYVPLFEGPWEAAAERWDRDAAQFAKGKWHDGDPLPDSAAGLTYAEWDGERPKREDYMPTWSAEETTHWQMYETTTEGTPLSPVMPTPEALAHWLADNGANTFADMTTDYETWRRMIGVGNTPCGIIIGGARSVSGVEAAAHEAQEE